MKKTTKTLKFAAILLLLAGMMISCGKENTDSINFYEVTIGSENPVINYVNNGIEFNFHLLNEQGEPSTIFNEGENFSFCFNVKNNNVNKEFEITGHLLGDLEYGGFCKVISQDQGDIGYPFDDVFCMDVLQKYPFYGENNTYELIVPWVNNREYWGLFLCGANSLQDSEYLPQEYLSRGKYYTEIKQAIDFYYKNELHRIPVSFKINFEVK
ncbi:MAG: hypothetical protein LBJ63_01540 [Prevotellaceae bacterium]|nr:hypothetical protein [Prevotellaceae bacterium]